MSNESLVEINEHLRQHLYDKGINDAFVYAPCNSDQYFAENNVRVAICNLETYRKDKNGNSKGIQSIGEETLDNWSDGNRTINNSFFLNYIIKRSLEDDFAVTDEQSLRILRKKVRMGKEGDESSEYHEMYANMDKSLYFNFRYSVSSSAPASNGYIIGQYKKDDYFSKHYREYVKAAKIDILIVGGAVGAYLIDMIYPDMKKSLKLCGVSETSNGTLIVSVPHPSRISYASMAECVNMIAAEMKRR